MSLLQDRQPHGADGPPDRSIRPRHTRERRRRLAPRLAIAIGAATLLACSEDNIAPLSPAVEPAHGVAADRRPLATVGWHEQARALVGTNNLNPLAAARIYAALAVAQYGAITEAKERTHAGGRRRFETERGAVSGASQVVLSYFFPGAADIIQQRARAEEELLGSREHPHFSRGLAVGMRIGNRMIDRVANDHFTDPWTGTVPVGPGLWLNHGPPAAPLLGNMTPYLIRSGAQFRPPPPPAFGSAAFKADLDEITMLSSTRTAEQLASALFWNFPTGTPTPPGYWNQVASEFIEHYRLNEHAAAHVFALMHAAMMDALIGCWDAKYFYWCIRPSQVDPSITLPTGLPNHPSYTSGHSCVSAAATTVLANFFPAQAEQLAEQLTQAGLSRMYGGIHYRFDITAGEVLGRSVGRWAIRADRRTGLLDAIRQRDRARTQATSSKS